MITQGGMALSKHDLKVFEVIEDYRRGKFTIFQAAEKLCVSLRTMYRKVAKVRKHGIRGLVHRNKGNNPHNRTEESIRQWYLDLYRSKYYDFNFKHAFEFICERETPPQPVSYETFRKWLRKEGLGKIRKRRSSKARIAREREANEGLMVQMDGSPHDYNGSDKWTLIHMIDDATGKLLEAQFSEAETTEACLASLERLIKRHGVPEFIVTDQAGWSRQIGKRGHFSQFRRACEDLGITLVATSVPESKGRVERSFRTAQDRLTAELRLSGIKCRHQANKYIEQWFLPDWNRRFAKPARSEVNRFKAIPGHLDLEDVICRCETRRVNRDHTVSLEGTKYIITNPPQNLYKHEVTVVMRRDGKIKILYDGREMEFRKFLGYKRERYRKVS